MKSRLLSSNRALWAAMLLAVAFCFSTISQANDKAGKKYNVQLVWGTNAEESPDKKHKLLEGKSAEKLGKFLKFKNYFLITEKTVTESSKTRLSGQCEVQIKAEANSMVKV